MRKPPKIPTHNLQHYNWVTLTIEFYIYDKNFRFIINYLIYICILVIPLIILVLDVIK